MRGEFLKELGVGSISELKEILAGKQKKSIDPSKLDEETQKRIKLLEDDNALKDARNRSQAVENALTSAVVESGVQLHNPEDFRKSVRDRFGTDKDGSVIVLDENGSVRFNSKAQRMTVAEYLVEFIKSRPYLVKTSVHGGIGAAPGQSSPYIKGGYSLPEGGQQKMTLDQYKELEKNLLGGK